MQIKCVFSTCCPDSALGWGVQHEINDKEHNYHGFESIKMLTSLEPLASVACVHVVHHSVWTQHSNLLHSKRCSPATDWQRSMKFCSILNIRFVLIARRRLHLPFARSQRSAATKSVVSNNARARAPAQRHAALICCTLTSANWHCVSIRLLVFFLLRAVFVLWFAGAFFLCAKNFTSILMIYTW